MSAAIGLNEKTGVFKIRSAPTKGMYQHMAARPGTTIALTGWNSYSRIDAVTGFEAPYLARLYIDSDAWTNILSWDGRIESVGGMREWYRALPFKIAPKLWNVKGSAGFSSPNRSSAAIASEHRRLRASAKSICTWISIYASRTFSSCFSPGKLTELKTPAASCSLPSAASPSA